MATTKTPETTTNGATNGVRRGKTPDTLVQDPYEWIDTQSGIKNSDDVKVPERLIDQVIGQEQAVAVAQKAAMQKRNLLLIGDPGTGKSMIANALKQMLPPVQLDDLLIYHNPADPNAPKVMTTKAGTGRDIKEKMKELARRKRVVRKSLEWSSLGLLMALGLVGFFIEG